MIQKFPIIFFLLSLFSCSNEKEEPTSFSIGKIKDADTNTHNLLVTTDSLTINSDSLTQTTQPVDSAVSENKVLKNRYPKREFITNTGEKDSIYLAYEWAITFFIQNGNERELDELTKIGFPMVWFASGKCSYYPVHVDSVFYFLKLARKIGYKDYGFDCEKIGVQDFDAALSNSIMVRLKPGESIDPIIKDYSLELKTTSSPQLYMLRAINLSAKKLIKTVELLNKDKRIEKASFTFRWCDSPLIYN